MSDINCRDYKENDYISLKNGGEGHIIKIIYVVMDNEEEVSVLKKCDLGNHTTKDLQEYFNNTANNTKQKMNHIIVNVFFWVFLV